jgi:hypothetical protein
VDEDMILETSERDRATSPSQKHFVTNNIGEAGTLAAGAGS